MAEHCWQPDRLEVNATCCRPRYVRPGGVDNWNDTEQAPPHDALPVQPGIASAERDSMQLHCCAPDHSPIPVDHLLGMKREPALELDFSMHLQANCVRNHCTRRDRALQIQSGFVGDASKQLRIE